METTPPIEISVSDAAVRLHRKSPADRSLPKELPLLLDCRTADEHATARIEGSVLIPMQEISERLAELEAWRDKPIIVHCHHGMRSLRVAKWLREQGFSLAQSMQGGIDAWSTDVDTVVPRY
jgi:rhodanese-related sulfurtransferase